MFCQQCGKYNPDGARFCDSCGASLQQAPVQQVPPPVYQQPPPVYPPPPPVYQPQPVYQQAPAYQQMPRPSRASPGEICGVRELPVSSRSSAAVSDELYNGETLKGAGLFVGAIIASAIFNLLGFIVVLFAIYDAFTTAKKINAGQVPFTGKSVLFWPVIILYIILIIVAVLFLGVLASGLSGY